MNPLLSTIRRECRRLCSRTVYLFAMIVVPVGCTIFFLSLLRPGLPTRTPSAVIDLDHSTLSRQITRELNSEQAIEITRHYDSYSDALAGVREGRIFGFFIIPEGFEREAVAGRSPSLDYYCNMTYFVPGTFVFKGFKTMVVTTTAGMVRMQLSSMGADSPVTPALIQPVAINLNSPGNPWLNYSYYLTPSFIGGLVALMVVLVTIFSITMEIKYRTSIQWLRGAGGSIVAAVTGKLLPQTVIFTIVGWCIQSLMFCWFRFPVAGSLWVMVLAMPLFIVACQAFGLFICSIMPNPRLAFSLGALTCILTFSFAGFSFPVEDMYGPIAVFSYLVPVRYYFQIHISEVLWDAPLYYSRLHFAALIIFPLVAAIPLPLLKRACLKQTYCP